MKSADTAEKSTDSEETWGHPWQDPSVLRRLYHEQDLTMDEIGDRLGCNQKTVHKWIHRHDIRITDPRGRGMEGRRVAGFPAAFRHNHSGSGNVMYEVWNDAGKREVPVHRLLAVAEYGFDAVCGMDVHHKNGIGWDNRPANIELMEHGEHTQHHSRQQDHEGGLFA
jgi:hypothetical protein